MRLTAEIEETQNDEWKSKNKKFDAIFNQDSDLKLVSGLMFLVRDENHRLIPWKQVIAIQHKNFDRWYGESGNPNYMVMGIPLHGVSQIQTAMHVINL